MIVIPSEQMNNIQARPSFFGYPNMQENSTISYMPFPWQLHSMLEAAECEGFEHIVSWLEGDRSFKVHRPDLFVTHIIPRFFSRQSKYKSFQRQLNIWQFQRLIGRRGPCNGGYFHVHFQRKDTTSFQLMKREKVRKAQTEFYVTDDHVEFCQVSGSLPTVLVSQGVLQTNFSVNRVPICNEGCNLILHDEVDDNHDDVTAGIIPARPTNCCSSCFFSSLDREVKNYDHQISSTCFLDLEEQRSSLQGFNITACDKNVNDDNADDFSNVSFPPNLSPMTSLLPINCGNSHLLHSSISQDEWKYVLIGLQLTSGG